jgi:hypothetical protein
MGANSEAQIVMRFVEMAKLLNVYLNHFPRHERYALSTLIRRTLYELFDLITEGQKRYHKKTTLTNLDITHERLRMQVWLAHELGYFGYHDGRQGEDSDPARRYLAINRLIDEVGRMIGGWISAENRADKGAASTC